MDWDISPASGLIQCSYRVALSVTDRTTNGYGLIHYAIDDVKIILLDLLGN